MLKIILIIVISISSCSKDRALVIIEDPDLSESYDIDYDAKTPKFNAKVRDYSLLSTRADNTLNNDNVIYRRLFYKDVVHIYFYKEGIYPDTGKYYCQALYKTNKKGLLIPVYDEVKIPPGIYNIYAVTALNSPYDQIPDFVDSTGVSNYIYNDVDYLWSNINDVDLRDEPSPTIEFVMEHLCCKLQFDFVAAEGDSINEVISANITAGDHLECSWAMNTGIINPATDINEIGRAACRERVLRLV